MMPNWFLDFEEGQLAQPSPCAVRRSAHTAAGKLCASRLTTTNKSSLNSLLLAGRRIVASVYSVSRINCSFLVCADYLLHAKFFPG